VRKQRVLLFLRFLKQHNPYYREIVIRPAAEVDLPFDGNVLHRLPVVETADRPDASNRSPAQNDASGSLGDEHDTSYVPDELSQEQNLFAPGLSPGRLEIDAICSGLQDAHLVGSVRNPMPWPAAGPPLSEYTTEGLFAMAFPMASLWFWCVQTIKWYRSS
jgi:hypothetical protein